MYVETDKNGDEVVRWDTKKKYTKQELEKQREEFSNLAKQGKKLCISDLMINHGL